MMFSVLGLDQSELWDSIVHSFKDYDVYWLSGYVKAFVKHGDGNPLLFYYEDGSNRGINVAMRRDIAFDKHFNGLIKEGEFYDLITPYGYGGWILEGDSTDSLFQEYAIWAGKNRIVSEFVRFHPLIHNHIRSKFFYDVSQLGEVVHMDLSSPEVIWDNITSKNRNMIRKAIKNGIRVYNGRFPAIYERFRAIYNETMQRDQADHYYYFEPEFYESVLEDLASNAQVFWAEKDDQVIAAAIVLAANGKLNYHLSGSLRQFSSFAPTNLILYRVALWGHANGYETLYLGGGVGSQADGLFRFKKAFYKGDLNHFYIGKKVFNQTAYEELVASRDSINDQLFFPKYRGD